MTDLDGKRAMDDIAGAIATLAAHPRFNGKVGITGFCMGGAYTLRPSRRSPDRRGVPFYGIPPWSASTSPR